MKTLILKLLPMLAEWALPELEARAAASKSKLDDFAVGLVRAVVDVLKDGTVQKTEVIRAGVLLMDKFTDVLADDPRIPKVVVTKLRELLDELRSYMFTPEIAAIPAGGI